MGVQGLLGLLKSIQKPVHLRKFAGQTLGVDAYGWLHRGTAACPLELAEGKPTRKHIDFVLHRVRMLIHFGVKPYLVFDGNHLPSKAHTEDERRERRKEGKRLGMELLRSGRRDAAYAQLLKAVNVTPVMARELIEELKKMGVSYIVAPYEADSQLVYLEKQGIINGIVSEDSDMLVFGAQCLLTKLDQYGECVMIKRSDFTSCREVSLVGWTDNDFRMMAMLSGCDYLPGLGTIGLKKAYGLVRKYKTVERVVRSVQFDGKVQVPPEYLASFQRAERTFLYQWVFCPKAHKLVHLTPLPPDILSESMPFIGVENDPDTAAGVACGDLHPSTKQVMMVPSRIFEQGRRSSYISTPDEKQGKPITEFFKARRTPLAELDPNSFTPSPSQRRVLEANENASWPASQLPAAAITTPTTNRAPLRPAQSLRRALTEPARLTNRSPPKRQKLCAEPVVTGSVNDRAELHTATSRFFAKQTTEDSPSLRKKSHRNKKEEFELWSDDSVAEAVAAATAIPEASQVSDSATRKRKKLDVFKDDAIVQSQMTVSDVSQSTLTTASTMASVTDIEHDTPSTSFASGVSGVTSRSVFDKGVNADLAAMKQRSLTEEDSDVSAEASASIKQFTYKAKVGEDQDLDAIHHTIPVSSPQAAPVDSFLDTLNEEDNQMLSQMRNSRANQKRRLVHELLSANLRGSEDLLVPESPPAPDDESGEVERRKLELGRFAFVG